MKINTIKAYMIKEFMELWRTRLIVMVYLMPLMIVLLFGYGIRMDVSHARILIIDNDQSKYSMQLVSKFEHTKYFLLKSGCCMDKRVNWVSLWMPHSLHGQRR